MECWSVAGPAHALSAVGQLLGLCGACSSATSCASRTDVSQQLSKTRDRPVYVFDEWAADQDPLFKRVFYTELLPDLRARGKAVLVITHDDQYFELADRCIKLEAGQLVEMQRRARGAVMSAA